MYHCANSNCKMSLLDLRPADLVSPRPTLNDLLVCGGCGCISKVTLGDTVLMSEDEVLTLAPDEQRDLNFAVRAIKVKLRNQ